MDAFKTIKIFYFASLRERCGRSEELRGTAAGTPAQLDDELRREYGFDLQQAHLRVAVNEVFAAWDRPLADGETVVFIPPVAGG